MKVIDLKNVEHKYKIGNRCPFIEPNITEDSIFVEDGEVIGFYKKDLKGKLKKLLMLIDAEFRSKNVPKSLLERSDVFTAVYSKGKTRKQAKANTGPTPSRAATFAKRKKAMNGGIINMTRMVNV